MNEIWKDIKGYEGKYQVSNLGRVRSLKYRMSNCVKVMSPQNNGKGYYFIGLRNKTNKRQHYYIHRLVYETFVGPIPSNMEINHIDCDPSNNALSNLMLATRKENLYWGDHSVKQSISQKNNKVTSKSVAQYTIDNIFLKEYPSQKEAERQTGIRSSNISMCCSGKILTAGGFKWIYS